jgi:modulator of FtsH protease HflC
MGKLLSGLGIIIVIVAVFFANMIFFTVKETEHVIILQFGDPVQVYSEAGLRMKLPWLETVSIDRRNIEYDMTQPMPIISQDEERLVVDAFIRYEIVDPLAYYASFKQGASNEWNALRNVGNSRLEAVLGAALRGAMGDALITEIITTRRNELMEDVKNATANEAKSFGVKIIDVRIKRADFPKKNAEKVYNRMRSERKQQAQRIRAEGEEAARRIRAEADKAVTKIIAIANEKSLTLQGEADGVRNCIFAGSYEGLSIRLGEEPFEEVNLDIPVIETVTGEEVDGEGAPAPAAVPAIVLSPEMRTTCQVVGGGQKDQRRAEFFAFYRSLQSYEQALGADDTTLILSPDSEFFRYFNDMQGR